MHRGPREGSGIEQAHPVGERVDAQCGPGQVEEGQRRQDGHLDPGVGPQEVDGALGHEGRSGYRVDDRLGGRVDGRIDERLHDRGVHLLEGRRGLVQVVEGAGPVQARRRRVTRRAQVGAPLPQVLRDRLREKFGARGPEAHHRDVGAHPRHAQPLDGLAAAALTPVVFAAGFKTSDELGVSGANTLAGAGTQTP